MIALIWTTNACLRPSHSAIAMFLTDGRHYDSLHSGLVCDIPFWIRQAKERGGPVLELACGTGRVTLPIASEGIEIVGIDISPSFLQEARRKSAGRGLPVAWVHADVRQFDLGRTFRLVIFPFKSLAVLLDDDALFACLSCVNRHLEPDGTFIIDAFNPTYAKVLHSSPETISYQDPSGNGQVVVTHERVVDPMSQVQTVTFRYRLPQEAEEHQDQLQLRMYSPAELAASLAANGFVVKKTYGGYDETTFESTSPMQLLVCELVDRH